MLADDVRPQTGPAQGRPGARLRALTRALAGLTDWLPGRYASGLELQGSSVAPAVSESGFFGTLKRIGRTLRDALVKPFEPLVRWAQNLASVVVAKSRAKADAQREEDDERERAQVPERLRQQAARERERDRQRVLADQVAEARQRQQEALSR